MKYPAKWTKETALRHWQGLKRRINPLPLMGVIPYKSAGSKYGACGIRIDGTPEFIDAVLSCLTELQAGESVNTRLELSRSKVVNPTVKGQTKRFENRTADAEVCYIRLHERGSEGKILAALMDGFRKSDASCMAEYLEVGA